MKNFLLQIEIAEKDSKIEKQIGFLLAKTMRRLERLLRFPLMQKFEKISKKAIFYSSGGTERL